MAKIHNYKIHNATETYNSSVSVTSYPVEKDLPLNDSVQRNPDTFTVSGKILDASRKNKNSNKKKQKIIELMNKGKVVKYVGRLKVSNVLITDINGTYTSAVGNGHEFSMSLQRVRIATTPYRKKKTKKKSSGKKTVKKKTTTKKATTKKVYHKVRRGDTYWGLSRKYGTSINQLRKWNKYPDRRIPIGVKLRAR